ncbi:MAG TPA: hypothetical protein VI815_04040 [Candidatus Nanoarchaeia archaeon]|nr:hypothetical protein [Candidatus Nanoarchaeia archaeon]
MTELNTLKDIEKDFIDTAWMGGEPVESKEVVSIIDLRTEAIKWIKEDRETPKINDYWKNHPELLLVLLEQRWKNRFNITEKDLEGEQTT